MIGLCGLDPEINKCQHYVRDKRGCGAETMGRCFIEPLGINKKIIEGREPK
jgi:hypothetical protein